MTESSGESSAELDWTAVEEIFHQISKEPREGWLAAVEAACGGNEEMAAEVLALLDSSGEASEQLDRSIRGAVDDWLDGGPARREGEPVRIGPFRILERIGEGGLAIVYLAERKEPYRQRVAIKLLKRGMDTDEILGRLKLEGQILAQLEHPNIARLLDGGWTEDGRPYFVLEYVEGEPIDTYCDGRRLPIRARLELFYRACLAVQQAHNRLIIHRDLKPSNLLVTEDGEPKLLDFGIAKLLDESRVDITTAHTRPGVLWMTPDYAAPEQVAGETLTTAVDVYALGILLYQLLCGSLPRRLAGKRPSEIERLFEQSPDPPSARVSSEVARARSSGEDRLAKLLRGDLDIIVGKALHPDPERRYASVQQLAEDVDRFLRSQPVVARPDTWSYRGAKFVRRNRAGVVAVSAVFVSLLTGVIVTSQSLRIAEEQRGLAEQRLDEVEAVIELTTGMFEIADPGEARGSTVTAREILDRGAERIGREMEHQPAISARLMDTMGRVYRNLGLYSSADDLLAAAADGWRRAAGEESIEALRSQRLRAAVLIDQGRFEEAGEVLGQLKTKEARLLDPRHADVASTLHLSALVASQLESWEAALGPMREALSRRLELFGEEHRAVAESRNDLGELLYQVGELEAAEEQYRAALVVRQSLLGPRHPLVAETLNNLATVLRRRGDLDEAELDFEKVLAIRIEVLGEVHRDVAVSLNNLAEVQNGLGRHAEALHNFRWALEIAEQTIPRHPTTAKILNNIGLELRDLGRLDEALQSMERALGLKQELYGEVSEHLVLPQFNYALLLSEAGHRSEAIERLQHTLVSMEILGLTDSRMAYPLTLLADLQAQRGRCDLSRPLVEKALGLRAGLPIDHPLRLRSQEVADLCAKSPATSEAGPGSS